MTLDAMAEGGKGRFVFGSASVPDDFANVGNTIPASKAPNAFALVPDPATPGPGVVLMLPYGEAMRAHSALLDVDRGTDGLLRDLTLRDRKSVVEGKSVSVRLDLGGRRTIIIKQHREAHRLRPRNTPN